MVSKKNPYGLKETGSLLRDAGKAEVGELRFTDEEVELIHNVINNNSDASNVISEMINQLGKNAIPAIEELSKWDICGKDLIKFYHLSNDDVIEMYKRIEDGEMGKYKSMMENMY